MPAINVCVERERKRARTHTERERDRVREKVWFFQAEAKMLSISMFSEGITVEKYEYIQSIIVEICIAWVGFSCWSSLFAMLCACFRSDRCSLLSRWRWTNYTSNFTNTSRLYSLNVCGKMLCGGVFFLQTLRDGNEQRWGGDIHGEGMLSVTFTCSFHTQRYKAKDESH